MQLKLLTSLAIIVHYVDQGAAMYGTCFGFCIPLTQGQCAEGYFQDSCGCFQCYKLLGEVCDNVDRQCSGRSLQCSHSMTGLGTGKCMKADQAEEDVDVMEALLGARDGHQRDEIVKSLMQIKSNAEEKRSLRPKGGDQYAKLRWWRPKPKGGDQHAKRRSWRPKGGDQFAKRRSWRPKGGDQFAKRRSWRPKGGDQTEDKSMRPKGGDQSEKRRLSRPKGGDQTEDKSMRPKGGDQFAKRRLSRPKGGDQTKKHTSWRPKGGDQTKDKSSFRPKGGDQMKDMRSSRPKGGDQMMDMRSSRPKGGDQINIRRSEEIDENKLLKHPWVFRDIDEPF